METFTIEQTTEYGLAADLVILNPEDSHYPLWTIHPTNISEPYYVFADNEQDAIDCIADYGKAQGYEGWFIADEDLEQQEEWENVHYAGNESWPMEADELHCKPAERKIEAQIRNAVTLEVSKDSNGHDYAIKHYDGTLIRLECYYDQGDIAYVYFEDDQLVYHKECSADRDNVAYTDNAPMIGENCTLCDRPIEEPDNGAGYYYVFNFPGCLNEGEPSGPYATIEAAYNDAIRTHDLPLMEVEE